MPPQRPRPLLHRLIVATVRYLQALQAPCREALVARGVDIGTVGRGCGWCSGGGSVEGKEGEEEGPRYVIHFGFQAVEGSEMCGLP